MKIYLMGEQCFVDLSKDKMLCIGSKEEVDRADGKQVVELIAQAMAWSQFREIESAQGQTRH